MDKKRAIRTRHERDRRMILSLVVVMGAPTTLRRAEVPTSPICHGPVTGSPPTSRDRRPCWQNAQVSDEAGARHDPSDEDRHDPVDEDWHPHHHMVQGTRSIQSCATRHFLPPNLESLFLVPQFYQSSQQRPPIHSFTNSSGFLLVPEKIRRCCLWIECSSCIG